jgi:hypothetical protein
LQQQAYNINLAYLIKKIYNTALSKNVFTNVFLRFAKQGLLLEKIKILLQALTGNSQDQIAKSLANLSTLGASSGNDLAIGLLWGIRNAQTYIPD